jgi:hypothetical protein
LRGRTSEEDGEQTIPHQQLGALVEDPGGIGASGRPPPRWTRRLGRGGGAMRGYAAVGLGRHLGVFVARWLFGHVG